MTEPRNGPPEGALGIRLRGDGHWGVRVGEAPRESACMECGVPTSARGGLHEQRCTSGRRPSAALLSRPCPCACAAGNSRDVLGSGIHVTAQMVHSVGADDHGMFSVFEGCRLERNGSLEMHRWGEGVVVGGGVGKGGWGCRVPAGLEHQRG